MQHSPETDHILEIQLVDLVLKRTRTQLGLAECSSQQTRGLKAFVNGLSNANVTTNFINQKKKGPFTSFKNRYKNGRRSIPLSQFINTSSLDDGIWGNITTTVVRTYEQATTELVNGKTEEAFVENLYELFNAMGIL
jgi:hypothetical protein